MALFAPWPVTRTVPDAFIACHPPAETARKKKRKRKREGVGNKFAPRLTFASNYSRSPRERREGREIDSRKELEGNVREIRVVEA